MSKIHTIPLIAILLLAVTGSSLAAAGRFQPYLVAAEQGYSLNEMAVRVRKDTGGQILSAEEVQQNGDRYYRFKVNKNGRIKVIRLRPDGTPVKRPR